MLSESEALCQLNWYVFFAALWRVLILISMEPNLQRTVPTLVDLPDTQPNT